MTWTIEKKETVKDALTARFPNSSKSNLKSWVLEGRVVVNGATIKRLDSLIEPGSTLEFLPARRITEEGIKIYYSDSSIIVIEKPAGLLSVATDQESEKTAHAILKKRLRKSVFPVHRLDRETSGVMMFALSPNARNKLKDLFAEHRLSREYVALVQGELLPKEGEWKSFLVEDASLKMRSAASGKLAITHFSVLNFDGTNSEVLFRLKTGRKNQIRVQAQEAGFPIIGDKKYGRGPDRHFRLFLHARFLAFPHPITGKMMEFNSPVPFSLRSANQVRKPFRRVMRPRIATERRQRT